MSSSRCSKLLFPSLLQDASNPTSRKTPVCVRPVHKPSGRAACYPFEGQKQLPCLGEADLNTLNRWRYSRMSSTKAEELGVHLSEFTNLRISRQTEKSELEKALFGLLVVLVRLDTLGLLAASSVGEGARESLSLFYQGLRRTPPW